jgi:hypothetical protein
MLRVSRVGLVAVVSNPTYHVFRNMQKEPATCNQAREPPFGGTGGCESWVGVEGSGDRDPVLLFTVWSSSLILLTLAYDMSIFCQTPKNISHHADSNIDWSSTFDVFSLGGDCTSAPEVSVPCMLRRYAEHESFQCISLPILTFENGRWLHFVLPK